MFRRLPTRFARFFAATTLVLVFAAAATGSADTPAVARPDDLISFLNQTILWYRQLTPLQQLVNEPSDTVFLNDNRQVADQVVRLSFDFARTEAQLLSTEKSAAPAPGQETSSPQYQNLLNRAQKEQESITRVQSEIEILKQQSEKATGQKRKVLESNIAEMTDELDLLKARHDTVENMLQFAVGLNTGNGSKGLREQIEELARTVPAAASKSSDVNAGGATQVAMATSGDRSEGSSGLFGLIAEIFEFRHKLLLLQDAIRLTDSLTDASRAVRNPLIVQLREFSQRSDELANQEPSQDTDALNQQRKQLQDFTAQYKQLSAAILPLGKQTILLDVYRRNLTNWQGVVQGQYSTRLKTLLIRLGILVGLIIAILAASEIWRRLTFRYVQDGRRRHQFLIVRRIVVGPLLAVIVVVAFANGLGSVTLFAGLSTAGLAVALQNLLQSFVGYFVLIGKFGVRVGDRVQVEGITGDVIDIGLARMHLVEVSTGPGSRPTGRVVAFANAVVFQANAGFFKQIPGTNFIWHEVSLTLGPEADYRQLEEKMLQAVNGIFNSYKDKMEVQRRSMENAVHGLSVRPLRPESRLHLTIAGTQVVVRYPVEVGDAAEVDDRMARAVLDATGQQPRVEAAQDETSTTEAPARK